LRPLTNRMEIHDEHGKKWNNGQREEGKTYSQVHDNGSRTQGPNQVPHTETKTRIQEKEKMMSRLTIENVVAAIREVLELLTTNGNVTTENLRKTAYLVGEDEEKKVDQS